MNNQQFIGLTVFLLGAVFAPFLFLFGPLLLVPGFIIVLLASEKKKPCKNCNAPFKVSEKICPKCGAPRV